jgi:hypothetical protein
MSTTGWLITSAAAVALGGWFAWRRTVRVPCAIDLEATQEHFHAHVELQGIDPNEGDKVTVHNAPTHIALNEVRTYASEATVERASLPRRLWQRVVGRTQITELYEVGFEG